MPGYGSAGKFYFSLLPVKQLGPWIGCVFRGNHEVNRANKALKQLRFAFLSYLSVFYNCGGSFAGSRCVRIEDFSFSDRKKALGGAFDRHCWAAACCSTHASNCWPVKLKF